MKKIAILCIILLIGTIGFVSASDNLTTSDSYIDQSESYFIAQLSDDNGSAIVGEEISFTINNVTYKKLTDENGISKLSINLIPGNYLIKVSSRNCTNYNNVYVRDTPTIFIDNHLSNDQIQAIIDSANDGANIEFLGQNYENIHLLVINKSLNLYGNYGTVLSGNNNNPILTISSKNTNVSSLVFSNSAIAIKVLNSEDTQIYNNSFINNEKSIVIKNSKGSKIYNNKISESNDGIYFDLGNDNTQIFNNHFNSNKNYAINLDKSGYNSNIYNNTFLFNVNGINVNCNSDNLNIVENTFQWNDKIAVEINEGFRSDNQVLNLENNAFLYNSGFNVRASSSIYDSVNLGNNFVGENEGYDIRTCPKAKLGVYNVIIKQSSLGSLQYGVYDKNGNIVSSLSSFDLRVSSNGGNTYSLVSINNGFGTVNVNNDEVVLDNGNGKSEIKLEKYVPSTKNITTEEKKTSPSNQTTANEESGISSENTISSSSSSSSGVSSSNGVAASTVSSSNQAANSVVKKLVIEDEFVKITGLATLILLILLVVGLYYRNDIREILIRRKNSI